MEAFLCNVRLICEVFFIYIYIEFRKYLLSLIVDIYFLKSLFIIREKYGRSL